METKQRHRMYKITQKARGKCKSNHLCSSEAACVISVSSDLFLIGIPDPKMAALGCTDSSNLELLHSGCSHSIEASFRNNRDILPRVIYS